MSDTTEDPAPPAEPTPNTPPAEPQPEGGE